MRWGSARLAPAPGHRRHDRDLVRVLEPGAEPVSQPDVLVVEIDVDELPGLPLLVEQAVLEAGVLLLQALDGASEIAGLHVHRRLTAAQRAQGPGNTELRQRGCLLQEIKPRPLRGTISGSGLFPPGGRRLSR